MAEGRRPTATVVITTRDRPKLARRAMASALGQSAKVDMEVVVVDDGSRRAFVVPPEVAGVRVIRHPEPRGVCAARNTGLEAATGRWIAFLDDDDELLSDMFRTSLEAIDRSTLPGPVCALSGVEVVDQNGRVRERRFPVSLPRGRHYFLEDIEEGSFQNHCTLVAETSLLRQIGGWDEDLLGSEHDDLFLRLNQVASIQGVRKVTYRIGSDASHRRSADLAARAVAMNLTIARHRDTFRQHRRHYGRYLRIMGLTYLRGGMWGPAVAATTRSLVVDPLSRQAWTWWLASLAGPPGRIVYRRLRPSSS